jgi:hypothetical protein
MDQVVFLFGEGGVRSQWSLIQYTQSCSDGRLCLVIATMFWSDPIPIKLAFIPSKLPHPNVPGSAIPFDIPLLKASEREIENFMLFIRKVNTNTGGNHWVLQDVANCAASYKGQLVSIPLRHE